MKIKVYPREHYMKAMIFYKTIWMREVLERLKRTKDFYLEHNSEVALTVEKDIKRWEKEIKDNDKEAKELELW